VIRQAISCDICASEKKQTNHWFVAYEQGGELRVSGWNSRNRLRPGSKHLCGQTCLHKLVDEFMANAIAVRTHGAVPEVAEVQERVSHALLVSDERTLHVGAKGQVFVRGVQEQAVGVDTSLTSNAAYVEVESSARLMTPPAPAVAAAVLRPQPGLVTMPAKPHAETFAPQQDEQRFASRNWHAEAWERERERELRAIEHRPDIAARRRSSA
jgi:hypothetical protein